ncbi:MAG: DegV family protein [Coriobacteriales bacterium]|nr:DegV family protein [Actinomycetes bacterium]
MSDALVFTDTACDLPQETLDEHGIGLLHMPYTLGEEQHLGDGMDIDDFYDTLRQGARSTTAQVRPTDCEAAFRSAYEQGKAAVVVTISSGLSASYDGAVAARERFMAEHPDAHVYVVDSLAVSVSQGLLLVEMVSQLESGVPVEEVVGWAESNRLRANAVFTVDTFEYLVRGGRVSAAVGAVGGMLDVKPVLHVDSKGELAVLKKTRGRKRALAMLADMTCERMIEPARQTVIINHGQCPEDAAALERLFTERCPVAGVRQGRIGVIIGTHVGPGGLAIGFWGSPERV